MLYAVRFTADVAVAKVAAIPTATPIADNCLNNFILIFLSLIFDITLLLLFARDIMLGFCDYFFVVDHKDVVIYSIVACHTSKIR